MSTHTAAPTRSFLRSASSLPAWLRDLREAVHENRRLNRRVAELTDLVTELMVPLARREDAEVEEILARYRSVI